MKKLLSLLLAVMLLMTLVACGTEENTVVDNDNSHNDPESVVKDYTMTEILDEMKIGWNLGNTLDAPNGETAWGQPVTTKEMFDTLKELGFNTIRVPTSWGLHTSGAPD